MQKTKLWLLEAIILIAVGIALVAVAQLVYMPRIEAFTAASLAWTQHIGSAPPPVPEAFGLDSSSMVICTTLGLLGGILFVVGAIFLVIALVMRVISKTTVQISIRPRW